MPKPSAAMFAPTWLDRAISYVAPTWGAHRMQSRMAMAVAQTVASGMVPGVRRLSSSREGTLGNWFPRREERLSEARSIDTIMAWAWLANVWTRPPRGQVDPTKEREAEQLGLDALTETRTSICHARGTDWDTVAKGLAREKRQMEKLGIAPAQSVKPKPSKDPKGQDAETKNGSENDAGEGEE